MTKDQKLIKIACKEFLMNIVKESEILNEKLSFFQKTLLYDAIREMSYDEVLSLLINNGNKISTEQKREFEGKTKKAMKYGAAATAGTYGIRKGAQYYRAMKQTVPAARDSFKDASGRINKDAAKKAAKKVNKTLKKGEKEVVAKVTKPSKNIIKKAMILPKLAKDTFSNTRKVAKTMAKPGWKKSLVSAVGGLFLYRKLSDPCVRKNIGDKQGQLACRLEAVKKVINQLNNQMAKCANSNNPAKCRSKIQNEIIKWQRKYQKLNVQYSKNFRK